MSSGPPQPPKGALHCVTSPDPESDPFNSFPSLFFPGIYQFRVPESSKSGAPVGQIKATDRDTGKNAEMFFTIVSGDGMDVFDIFTDKVTQEGVITVSKVSRRGRCSGIRLEGRVGRGVRGHGDKLLFFLCIGRNENTLLPHEGKKRLTCKLTFVRDQFHVQTCTQ